MRKLYCATMAPGLLMLIGLLSSCATTQVVKSWKDPTFSPGQIKKILVLGVGLDKQQLLEESLVKNFSKRNLQATAASSLSPQGARWDKEGLKRVVSEQSFDTVVVSRLVYVETVEKEVASQAQIGPSFHASGHAGYYGYYDSTYRMIDESGYTITENTAVVETRLYDAKTEKLLWSADSRTQVQEGANKDALIREFAGRVDRSIFRH